MIPEKTCTRFRHVLCAFICLHFNSIHRQHSLRNPGLPNLKKTRVLHRFHIELKNFSIIMNTSRRQLLTRSPHDNKGKQCRQFKGIHMRKWGKWVSEVRIPNSRAKFWLGSYDTAEQVARAYDAAVYCLRGLNAKFNFPNSIPAIPSASSLSRHQIQLAAAKYALDQIPAINNSAMTEEPSMSSSVSEMEALSDSQLISEELDLSLWESLLGDSDANQPWNLDKLPLPFPNVAGLELTPAMLDTDPIQLWSF